MTTALLALGSNLGERQWALQQAVSRLKQLPQSSIVAVSTFRETQPVNCPPAMPPFINAAIRITTLLEIHKLFDLLRTIERDLGRIRTQGDQPEPRTIDIDLILFGDTILNTPDLTVPHPRMHLRPFVLEPLAEIAPDLRHPVLGYTMLELWRKLQPPPPAGRTNP